MSQDPGKRDRTENGIPVVQAIDGVRWLAIVSVVAAHVWGASNYAALRGTPAWTLLSAAVASFDLFFIVSGFVMFLPAAARNGELGSTRGYVIRRVARIFPGYVVCLTLLIAFFPLLVVGHPAPFSTFGGAAILSHLTCLQTEALIFPSLLTRAPVGFGIDGPVWTLSVEVCFYALLPLVARRFYRRPVALLIMALTFSTVFRLEATQISTGWLELIGYPVTPSAIDAIANGFMLQFPCYVGDFAIGMFCAWAMVQFQRRPLGRWQPAGALVMALLAVGFLAVFVPPHGGSGVAVTHFHRDAAVETIVPLVLGALLLGITLAPARATAPLANRFIVRLAEMSYGTYLYHLPLLLFAVVTLGLPNDSSAGSFLLLFAFTLVTSSVMGWLSYVAIERPMRLRGHRWAKRSPVTPAPAAVLVSDHVH